VKDKLSTRDAAKKMGVALLTLQRHVSAKTVDAPPLQKVGGVVHTHSTYATAWAARGEAVPCVITAMADEFGGEIPLGPFALIGSDEIGRGIVSTLTGHRSPAVLMRSHGVFTIGRTARDAVKAAVMCEDAARTVHLAQAYGELAPLARDQVDALHRRYTQEYGQRPEGM